MRYGADGFQFIIIHTESAHHIISLHIWSVPVEAQRARLITQRCPHPSRSLRQQRRRAARRARGGVTATLALLRTLLLRAAVPLSLPAPEPVLSSVLALAVAQEKMPLLAAALLPPPPPPPPPDAAARFRQAASAK